MLKTLSRASTLSGWREKTADSQRSYIETVVMSFADEQISASYAHNALVATSFKLSVARNGVVSIIEIICSAPRERYRLLDVGTADN